ncbi:MAG: pilus assembly PilX family protein [Terriglobales bacterium]
MTRRFPAYGQSSERGFALFIAIFTLLLITGIAISMIMLTNTDTSISSNFRDEQVAFFAAKAGVEEVRDRLRANAPNSLYSSLPTTLPGQANGVLYITNPANGETVAPWTMNGTNYPDDEICTDMTNLGSPCSGSPAVPAGSPWYTSTTASATYATNPKLLWKWARIIEKTNKTSSGTASVITVDGDATDNNELVCWSSTTEVTTTQATCAAAGYKQAYVITALAVTPSGSRRMVQMDVAAASLPTIPGAMVFDGASPTYGAPSSNAFSVTGVDQSSSSNPDRPQNGVTCPAPVSQPALGGFDAASTATLNSDISGRPSSYTGSPASVANVSSTLGPLATVAGLNQLVNTITGAANNVYNGNVTSLANPGTPAAPVINVVTGDLTMSGGLSGSGILLVEGSLTLSGTPSYNGLVLVIGKGIVTKNGGGNGTFDGAMLVANLYDSGGTLITSGPPGRPSINWNGGGNATVQYDSCWASSMNLTMPYKSLGIREMAY